MPICNVKCAASLFWGLLVAASSARADGLLDVAGELGITAESATVAGLEPVHVMTALGILQQADDLRQALSVSHQQVDAAASQVSDAANALCSAPGDAPTVAQYQQAVTQFADDQGVLLDVWEQLSNVMTQGMPPARLQRLVAWRSGAPHAVPAEFRVHERTRSEWKAIVRALRAEARAERMDEELEEDHAALLDTVRSDPLVVEAAQLLDTNLAVMQAVFLQFDN